jgi:transcriptional regulator with XRE-family HTH domain
MKIDSLTPNEAIQLELGRRLERVRKSQGLSQERLAAEAGIGVATLRRIEDGRDAQLGSWLKLLKALDMETTIDALLPETFRSPMAEVLPRGKRSARHTDASFSWGDEER